MPRGPAYKGPIGHNLILMAQVSIITPAYNAEPFISATIESVLGQSFQDWELLVADDVSSDRTPEIVAGFADRDPRVRLLRRGRNGGPAAARNTALRAAAGRYIAFLDNDDLWLREKLARQVTFMQENDCAISYTAYRRMSEDGRKIGPIIQVPSRLTYAQLLRNTAIANMTAMVDRQQTGPFELVETWYDDYILWLSLLRRGFTAAGLSEDLARYRVVSRSVSSNSLRAATWVWRVYRDHEGLSPIHATWCLLHYAARATHKRWASRQGVVP